MDQPTTNKRTRLDRSLTIVLPDVSSTPSQRHGIDAATERLYRLYGTCLIQQACRLLSSSDFLASSAYGQDSSLNNPDCDNEIHPDVTTTSATTAIRPSTFITACVLFQRLFHRISLTDMDVWAAAMGSLFCAAKTEEIALTARQVIVVFVHLYRRRRLLVGNNDMQHVDKLLLPSSHVVASPKANQLSWEETQMELQTKVPALSSVGPIWKDWFDALIHAEGQILRLLGFIFYWIPQNHAHRYLPDFLRALSLDQYPHVCQAAWKACNDAYRLDLCVQYPPEIICAAAILLVVSFSSSSSSSLSSPRIILPSRDWWNNLVGLGQEQALANCTHAIAQLTTLACSDPSLRHERQLAEFAFLKPLVKDTSPLSFNGPDSFVWEMDERNL